MSDNPKSTFFALLALLGNVLFVWVIFHAFYKLFSSSSPGVKLLMWILVFFFIINVYLKYR
jgi:hypothetical protein